MKIELTDLDGAFFSSSGPRCCFLHLLFMFLDDFFLLGIFLFELIYFIHVLFAFLLQPFLFVKHFMPDLCHIFVDSPHDIYFTRDELT